MKFALDHIHFKCQDLEASVSYYEKILEAQVERRFEVMGMPVVKLKVGDVAFSLSPKKQEEAVKANAEEPKWGAYQIGLRVADMSQAVAEIGAKGGLFSDTNVEVVPGVLASFLMAPDGVEIELIQLP